MNTHGNVCKFHCSAALSLTGDPVRTKQHSRQETTPRTCMKSGTEKWNTACPQGATSVESHPKTPPDQDHKTRHQNIRTSVACRTAVVPSALEWAFRSSGTPLAGHRSVCQSRGLGRREWRRSWVQGWYRSGMRAHSPNPPSPPQTLHPILDRTIREDTPRTAEQYSPRAFIQAPMRRRLAHPLFGPNYKGSNHEEDHNTRTNPWKGADQEERPSELPGHSVL